MVTTYLDEQQLNLTIGTEAFYQFASEQIYGETAQSLTEHPSYSLIRAYLIRYTLAYQDYLQCMSVLERNVRTGEALITQLSDENPCLVYNFNTKELSFVLTNGFLTQTLAERKAQNDAKFSAAELAATQAASTSSVTSYSVANAVSYARQYIYNRGTIDIDDDYPISSLNYPNYDANCTNFVSQCIHAGGVQKVGTNNIEGIYDSTTQWYCYKTNTPENPAPLTFAVSTSWIRADDFCTYMTLRANKKWLWNPSMTFILNVTQVM